jgi:hypothetical protein
MGSEEQRGEGIQRVAQESTVTSTESVQWFSRYRHPSWAQLCPAVPYVHTDCDEGGFWVDESTRHAAGCHRAVVVGGGYGPPAPAAADAADCSRFNSRTTAASASGFTPASTN